MEIARSRAFAWFLGSGQVAATIASIMVVSFVPIKTYLDVECIKGEQSKMRDEIGAIHRELGAIGATLEKLNQRRGWMW